MTGNWRNKRCIDPLKPTLVGEYNSYSQINDITCSTKKNQIMSEREDKLFLDEIAQ